MNKLTHQRLCEVLELDFQSYTFKWRYQPNVRSQFNGRYAGKLAGVTNGAGGLQIAIDRVRYKAHRLVWFYIHQEWPNGELDHRDNNPYNNHIDNLRIATAAQNGQNKKINKNNKSGYKGVWYCKKRDNYEVKIKLNGKSIYLGRYNTAEEAHKIYCEAAVKYHGEFARVA